MKQIKILYFVAFILLLGSCKKFLDVNKDPNTATSATPQLILPQALVATASYLNGSNSMGAQVVGHMANAGGYGGFGSSVTYSFAASDFSARWGMYDVLEDYYQIIQGSAGNADLRYFNSIGRIMRAHGFSLLVDAYNSIPYYDALQGLNGKLTPKYDDPAAIYADLGAEIDKAIDTINLGLASTVAPAAVKVSQDPMFGGNMTKWKQFANTLKLRLMVKGNGKATFAKKTFDAAGFLTTDALVNPGYGRNSGKQNPKWETWGFGYTGSDANKAWMPNTFVFSFYNGVKLLDAGRGAALYYKYPSTGTNQLGYENNSVTPSPSGSFWYPSANRDGKTSGASTGVLKGPEASSPVLTASESYFLQAEAALLGIISKTDAETRTLFESGITASFKYLYLLPDMTTYSGNPVTASEQYLTDNSASPLVNWAQATTVAKKQEAIITQKYIALNMVNSDQAWDDYRRTGYPSISGTSSTSTFASTQSKSTRTDRLPSRILYPASEGATNSANVPQNISPYTSLIFWAK